MIDLRSDTVTQPTAAMRSAMADAVVGDDILRDDPTVLELEALAAERLGKEAAMFTISDSLADMEWDPQFRSRETEAGLEALYVAALAALEEGE